jgi:DNA-binding transcriptional LysR family regulator
LLSASSWVLHSIHGKLIRMEFKQLEMFVAVVQCQSLVSASDRVCRTQPAVSVAIKKLGEEIGLPLFDRSQRTGYRLTEAGELLYDYAQQILGMRDEAERAFIQSRSKTAGRQVTL